MTDDSHAIEAALDAANLAGDHYEEYANDKMIRAAVRAYLAAMEAEAVMVPISDLEELVFQFCWRVEGKNTEQARIHAKARLRAMLAARPQIGKG